MHGRSKHTRYLSRLSETQSVMIGYWAAYYVWGGKKAKRPQYYIDKIWAEVTKKDPVPEDYVQDMGAQVDQGLEQALLDPTVVLQLQQMRK